MFFCRYLSTLYSHPNWPNAHPSEVRDVLKKNVKDNWVKLLLTPSWMHKRLQVIRDKKARGQPVSFTDFFGYLIGDTVLKEVSFVTYVFWLLVLGSVSGKFKLPKYPCRDQTSLIWLPYMPKGRVGHL